MSTNEVKYNQNSTKYNSNKNKINSNDEDDIQDKVKQLAFLPIIIVLGIIPLIVRVKMEAIPSDMLNYYGGSINTDMFSYWKSGALLFTMGVILFCLFFFFKKSEMKKSKVIKYIVIGLIIYAVITVISAVMSEHKSLVWWGTLYQKQGAITLVSYVVITLYSIYTYNRSRDFKFIIIPISIMIIIEGFIITTQFMGSDIYFADWFRGIIIPTEYDELVGAMQLSMKGKAYGSLFNPNYVGSFVALLLPIFVMLGIKENKTKNKIVYIFIAGILIFSVFASGSRAGIMGIAGSILITVLLFGNKMLKKPKMLGGGIIVVIVAVLGINLITGGLVIERTSSIIKDAASVFGSGESDVLDEAPIQEFGIEDNKLKVAFINEEILYIDILENGDLLLTDGLGAEVEYTIEDEIYYVPSIDVPVEIALQRGGIAIGAEEHVAYALEVKSSTWFLFYKDETMITTDLAGDEVDIIEAESIGFAGKERVGSNRGYIWSRSLPILRDNLLIGVGPDGYIKEFPFGDVLVRNYIYGTSTTVDKPHNLYLQIGINQGIIALGAFLFVNGLYIINNIKLYAKKKSYTLHNMFGIGIMVGVVGYLVAGIFNDSVISVAPLYWCLLGIGIAVDYINKNEEKEA